MRYAILYKRSASEELLNLPEVMARKVLAAINGLADNPRPTGCKKLKGRINEYRLRFGNYRLIYTVSDAVLTVIVIKIAHRKQAYRK
jgi:mRNA interferase RelE/StbE